METNHIHSDTNAGLVFHKHYYNEVDFKETADKSENEKLLKAKNTAIISIAPDIDKYSPKKITDSHSFELTTQYPGLVTGTGVAHGTKTTGEFKLGFSFDYTTGLPVINGSSVKGMLRSAFKHNDYIKDILTELKVEGAAAIDIPALEAELFDGKVNGKYISIYHRDVFFDAVVSGYASVNNENRVFATDSITPHKHPLKDPIPLLFLKVAPGAAFTFSFHLPEREGQLLAPNQRMVLYKQLLLDLGIGAKTNVGYGQFTATTAKNNHTNDYNDEIPTSAASFLLKDKSFNGTVTQITETHIQITFTADKYNCTIWKKSDKIKGNIIEGTDVVVKITNPYDTIQKLACKVTVNN